MGLDHYLSLLAANGCRRVDGGGTDMDVEQEIQVDGQRISLWFVPGDGDFGEDLLMARTDVARLAATPSAALCRRLLQANAFWSGIHGGALGLRGTDVVMLSVSQRLASLDAPGLNALLQRMASDARRWATAVRGGQAPAPDVVPSHGLLA